LKRSGWAAIGAAGAALLAVTLATNFAALLVLGCASAAVAAVWRAARLPRQDVVLPLVVGALLVLGRAAVGVALTPAATDQSTAVVGSHHLGVVLSVGTPDGGLQRAVVQLRPPEPADSVYLWLPRYPQVVQADEIAFDGPLQAPPDSGDFADYLARSGIAFTARPRDFDLIGSDGSALAALEGLRRTAADLISHVLPEPQAGLATAMAIGLRDVVAREVTDDFRTSGLSHVVAISGWHIAMLGAVVAALLGGLPRRPRSLLVVIAIFAYAILAGAAPSILRAAVMASAVIVARESGRRGQAASALALTVTALLLLDPASVADAGFQLSSVATAGLLAWATPLHTWLLPRVPQRTPGWLLEALAVSLAAQASTLPLVLLQFGQLSLVAPLANLLIAPLVAPAMLLTAICFVAGATVVAGVPALVVAPVTLAGTLLIGAMIWIAHWCATLPFASLQLGEPLNYIAAAVSAVLIAIVVRRARRPKPRRSETQPKPRAAPHRIPRTVVAVAAGAACLSLLVVVVAVARPDGRLHVTVLDIGQGDSILLQGPKGGRMLIDTGPDPDLELRRLDARIPAWDRRIDVVVLTHPHEDHVGGLWLLLERYRIGTVVESGMVGLGPGDGAYRRVLAQQKRATQKVAAGDRLALDGIELDVDWPPAGTVPARASSDGKQVNNESIVLDLRFGSRRMLFTGDMEQEIDPQLIARGLAAHLGGAIDVLKVAHHGSGTATTDALLDVLQPRVAVISVGADNDYGHPSPNTINRLNSHGATVYRTDLDGSVDISTNGSDLVVGTDKQRPTVRLPVPDAVPLPVGIQTYNRIDVRAHASRGRRARRRPAAQRQAAQSFARRRRGRGIPCRCHGPPRRRG
jgi:competence protein ComEC